MNSLKAYCLITTVLGMILIGIHQASARDLILSISGQTMTLRAENLPLQTILKQISALGISVKIDPRINPRVTADFRGKNIQEALAQIVSGNSHALVWKEGDRGNPELSEIVIYRQGSMGDAALLESSSNLDIEENPDDGTVYVKNKILIQFRQPVSSGRIEAVLQGLNASISPLHGELALYEITLPVGSNMAEALAALNQVPGVGTVEPDYAYKTPVPAQYETDHQISTDIDDSRTTGASPVAVLDSGLNPDFLSQDLNLASLDALAPGEGISDNVGHGTQMALIASGLVDPMGLENETFFNPVISIRAFDDNGYTSNAVLIRSIDFAIAKGAAVMSLSWGSETDSAFLKQAMAYADSKGLKVVAAAGNNPTGKPVYPAAYDTVISVAALAPDGKPWDRSNYGDFVDISAPGFARLPVGHGGEPGTYAGTSIATAYVAGKLAVYLRKHPGKEIILKNNLSKQN